MSGEVSPAQFVSELESAVLVQLAEWRSVVDPLSTSLLLTHVVCDTLVLSPRLASQWPEDLDIPAGGNRDDCDGVIHLSGKGRSPSVPCFCGL